jgi:hypothetical protein
VASLSATLTQTITARVLKALTQTTLADDLPAAVILGTRTIAEGSGAGQATKLWHQRRTLATMTDDDIVLTSLTDSFGTALSFTTLKLVYFALVAPLTTRRLVLGGHPTDAWVGPFGDDADTIEVRLSLALVSDIDGWSVVSGNAIRVNNPTAGSLDYDLVLIGT